MKHVNIDYINIIIGDCIMEVTAHVRTWGRSLGIVIPKDAAKKGHFKSGDEVQLIILKKTNPVKETFGTVKLKRSTEEILREVDKEAWDD